MYTSIYIDFAYFYLPNHIHSSTFLYLIILEDIHDHDIDNNIIVFWSFQLPSLFLHISINHNMMKDWNWCKYTNLLMDVTGNTIGDTIRRWFPYLILDKTWGHTSHIFIVIFTSTMKVWPKWLYYCEIKWSRLSWSLWQWWSILVLLVCTMCEPGTSLSFTSSCYPTHLHPALILIHFIM